MENQEFDILLNKFIENTISQEELIKLKSFKQFSLYEKVLNYSSDFKAPHIDEQQSFDNFINKATTKTNSKVSKLVIQLNIKTIVGGIAAAVLLLFGLFQILNPNQTYTTDFGEQLAVLLPDSSQVLLNAETSITFDKKNWDKNRTVSLQGEAFFKVKKGSKFKVVTEEGIVSVLGTQFNVNEQEDFLEVQCFEGKVSVERNGEQFILLRGQAVRQIKENSFEEWNFTNEGPSWENFESSFKNTPLQYIIKSFEKTYGVEIITQNIDLQKRFSGSFPNTNKTVAIETIANSMNLEYQIKNDKQITLRSK
ncbi:FecR family protein [Tenacibaculum amylolyticum]|uniref:FecR family protein n=1 Tax=Tenacibaculum amylolyticum TaxID=104269 RepID=UPI003892ED2A